MNERNIVFDEEDLARWRQALLSSKKAKAYLRSRGLLKISEEYAGGYCLDRFARHLNERIVFPLRDVDGAVVGVQGRAIDPNVKPKYWHTPFDKGDKLTYLYGLYEHVQRGEKTPIVIQEGSPDVWTLARFDVSAVCVWGSVLGDYQAWLLKAFTSKVYLGYDDDDAGHKATEHAEAVLKSARLQYEIKRPKKAKDWTEYAEKYGKEAARKEVARVFSL